MRESGDPTAPLDAALLLAHVLGVGKEALYAHGGEPVPDELEGAFGELVERRAAGEPVAYLRGWKEFYGLRFAVDPRVLIPRPETEVLVDAVRDLVRRRGASLIADVGTGSGAIAVAVAVHEPGARLIASDLSADALAVARENALAHGVAARIDLRQGDLLSPIGERVDVVAANLPYLRDGEVDRFVGARTSLAFEPRSGVVAGPDGLELMRRCAADLSRVLAPGGSVLFECDPPQASAIAELLSAAIRGSTRVLRDLSGDERVVAVERERGR
ncbi:MAG: peptide chain release factor N(5)-glutamine methyltransferase [Chloroflexota bacterium]|nr:peptide chain release factor N(5)-glutamine methyltransferase [Chloroflexota bacterium]